MQSWDFPHQRFSFSYSGRCREFSLQMKQRSLRASPCNPRFPAVLFPVPGSGNGFTAVLFPVPGSGNTLSARWWMKKENRPHTHSGRLFSHKKEEMLAFVKAWMKLGGVLTSEINHNERQVKTSKLRETKRSLAATRGFGGHRKQTSSCKRREFGVSGVNVVNSPALCT